MNTVHRLASRQKRAALAAPAALPKSAVQEQIDSYDAIAQRFQRTGRVDFTGPVLLTARAAAEVFTDLIKLDRNGYAKQAAI